MCTRMFIGRGFKRDQFIYCCDIYWTWSRRYCQIKRVMNWKHRLKLGNNRKMLLIYFHSIEHRPVLQRFKYFIMNTVTFSISFHQLLEKGVIWNGPSLLTGSCERWFWLKNDISYMRYQQRIICNIDAKQSYHF